MWEITRNFSQNALQPKDEKKNKKRRNFFQRVAHYKTIVSANKTHFTFCIITIFSSAL